MASVASETDLVNAALSHVGRKPITSLEQESSTTAEHARRLYPQVRDAMLRSHQWAFAEELAELVQDGASPIFGYAYAYALPNDLIEVRDVFSIAGTLPDPYRVSGRLLLCDAAAVSITYTKRVTNTGQFDPLFARALVLRLAADLVGPLANGDNALWQRLNAQADASYNAAVFRDAEGNDDIAEAPPPHHRDSGLVRSRFGTVSKPYLGIRDYGENTG